MLYDQQKLQELEEARRKEERKKARETLKKYSAGKNKGEAKKVIRNAKGLMTTLATPWGALGLIFQANISDWMYWLAIFAAMLKDLLDWVLIGSLPGIGTAITFCVSIFIGLMMLLGGFMTGHGRKEQKIVRSWLRLAPTALKKYAFLLFGTTAELLFGVNFIPIETITVFIIYGFVLFERKQAKEDTREENRQMAIEESFA